ncbi:MAG TPA: divalent metal cation transporter, partial [Pyrinomonadaceae bacterium]|nr:divalent metal cation transporter [Pyrinomonadaceae bacterium]
HVLLVTQVINGLLLPIVLIAVLVLVNDRELMGKHVNGPLHNVLAGATTIVVTILSLAFILISVIKE